MKISKLFHHLYAILMLLPIFAIGVTCFTTFWNNTIDMPTQEVTEIPSYQTNEVNSVDDLVVGNIYDFQVKINYSGSQIIYFRASKVFNIIFDGKKMDVDVSTIGENSFGFRESSTYYSLVNNGSLELNAYGSKSELENVVFQFVYYSNFNVDYISQVSAATWTPNPTYQVVETTNTELNIFYYALDEVSSSPYFAWSYNSFLVAPFSYIASLFNVPSNSPIIMFLSYWLSISIIWLVFDLIMYFPLLVHRWIDKGIVE